MREVGETFTAYITSDVTTSGIIKSVVKVFDSAGMVKRVFENSSDTPLSYVKQHTLYGPGSYFEDYAQAVDDAKIKLGCEIARTCGKLSRLEAIYKQLEGATVHEDISK